MDDDYPRDISVGFENMPNDVDAAFAIPAPSLSGKEKAYFFKGTWRGEFSPLPWQAERLKPALLYFTTRKTTVGLSIRPPNYILSKCG